MKRGTALTLGAVLWLGGCDLITGPDELERLDDARTRWALQGSQAYSYEVRRTCYCGYPAGAWTRVEVRDHAAVAAWDLETGEPLPGTLLPSLPTIERLFVMAGEMIAGADHYRIRYDPTLGYPMEIFVDWIAQGVDDEVYITAREVIALPQGAGPVR